MTSKLLLLCFLGVASANAMACYTVYDSANHVVYSAATPPVDMSRQLHQTIRPGYHMVFDAAATDCAAVTEVMRRQPTASSSPLLTDRATAAALNLPHAVTSSGVAVVPAAVTARLDLPTFNVVPSDVVVSTIGVPAAGTVLSTAPTTAVMGASRSPTSVMGAGAAATPVASVPTAYASVQRRDQPRGPVPQGHGIRFLR